MIPVALSFAAAVLLGAIPLQLHVDTRRCWAAETERWRTAAAVDGLPAPRQDLTGAWPLPVTVMDLPARWDTTTVVEAPSRVRPGRHRAGEAPGTVAQQARWNSPTGQFWAIVEFNAALDEPCSHCAAPEDGEPAHVGCPGCACPCGTVPALPPGVDGHAIAGRTR